MTSARDARQLTRMSDRKPRETLIAIHFQALAVLLRLHEFCGEPGNFWRDHRRRIS